MSKIKNIEAIVIAKPHLLLAMVLRYCLIAESVGEQLLVQLTVNQSASGLGNYPYQRCKLDDNMYKLYIIWLEVLPYNAHCHIVLVLHSINTPLAYVKRRVSRVQTTKTAPSLHLNYRLQTTNEDLRHKKKALCNVSKTTTAMFHRKERKFNYCHRSWCQTWCFNTKHGKWLKYFPSKQPLHFHNIYLGGKTLSIGNRSGPSLRFNSGLCKRRVTRRTGAYPDKGINSVKW